MITEWETKRLLIRHFNIDDGPYILRQLNEDSFIQNIADKNIRTLSDAEDYLRTQLLASYRVNGHGLNQVLLKDSGQPIGMCGLVKRSELAHPDLGYAFLPEFWGKGYALESSEQVLKSAVTEFGYKSILGIVLPNNLNSNILLKRLGFTLQGKVELFQTVNNLYQCDVVASCTDQNDL